MSGLISIDELRELHRRGEIETVICAIPDHWGRLVGKRVRAQTFLDVGLGEEGLHGSLFLLCVDMEMEPREGYALTGWQNGFPDFRFAPDLSTLRRIPWQEKTALVICDAVDEATGELVEVAPRTILRRQVERAARHGLSVKCATELEFYLFRGSLDEAWATRYEGLRPTSRYRSDYHIFQGTLEEDFTREAREALSGADLEIEFSKPEWGIGQQEINTRYSDAMRMADRHIIFKTGIKEIAVRHGMVATFMAKPFFQDVGSSCHVHVSLWDETGDTPVGWDSAGANRMSDTMARFLAGSLATARELAVTLAPTINSYKRIQPESFAPVGIAWGLDNRTCSHRLIGHGRSYRFENRIPGADVHPHIALAGIIAGGLHGIEEALSLPPAQEGNAYETSGLDHFPRTLGQAVELLQGSSAARAAFGDVAHAHLVTHFATEDEDFQCGTVTDWERMRYFERI